jgi:DNA modification methylase
MLSMDLADLKPAPYNPRKISPEAMKALGASLASFGDISGVTWNKRTGHLVSGHQRLKVLQEAYGDGLAIRDEVLHTPDGGSYQVRVVDWPLSREKLANLAANSPYLAGEFDEGLEAILDELSADEAEMFEALRLEELRSSDYCKPGLSDPDDVPEPPDEAITKPGDLWLMGDHRMVCGDATCDGDYERVLDGAQVNCVWTDPPYGVAIGDKNADLTSVGRQSNRLTDRMHGDHGFDEAESVWRESFKAIFAAIPPGCPYYVCGPQGGELGLLLLLLKEAGLVPRHILIWRKSSPTFSIGRLDYNYQHEPIAYGWKPGAAHPWYATDSRTSILECAKPHANKLHPTMKPVELIAGMLSNSTTVGDIVLDPFVGSGSTIIAAQQLGRRCYGMEIEPRYVDVCVKRWEAFTGQKAVKFEPTLAAENS